MIATDKYEGHTTDWEWKDIGVSLAICSNGEAICFDTPDGNLAQDAPLLLEEVKRLRKVMSKIGCSLCDECGLSIEEHIRYHTENDVIAGCPFGED